MNSNIQKVSLEELLYYIMFSLLLSLKGFGLDEGSIIFRIGLVCAILLFGMKTLVGRYSIRELLVIAVGGIWSIFIFFNMGSLSIVVYALIVLGMKNVSVSKVMKIGVWVWSICFFITITLAIFMDRVGVRVVHEKLGLGPVLRESLGYGHPNVLHVTYILFMAFVLYMCKKEKVLKTIIGLTIGNIYFFMYSLSYTGLLISVVLIVVYLYFIYRKNITKIERVVISSVFPACILLSTVIAYLAEGRVYDVLNKLLNNRIWAIQYFFGTYNITAFGERISQKGFSIDNSYMYALAWYGLVFFVIIVIGYLVLVEEYLKENRRRELAIVITFLIAGLTEQFLFNASIKNITFVFLGEVLYKYIGHNEKEFKFASKYNQIINIKVQILLNFKELLKKISQPKIVIRYLIVNIFIVVILLFVPTNHYQCVYVNERMCDCDGELVSKEQVESKEDSLIIGSVTEEDQYYYFTEENSNFIQVMDKRYKLSLSIYLSLLVTLISVWVKVKRGENNEAT